MGLHTYMDGVICLHQFVYHFPHILYMYTYTYTYVHGGEGLLHSKPVQGLRLTKIISLDLRQTSRDSGSLFEDLDDWEVTTGCHQNQTLVSQLIQALVYFRLVWRKSSDMIFVNIRTCVHIVSVYTQHGSTHKVHMVQI